MHKEISNAIKKLKAEKAPEASLRRGRERLLAVMEATESSASRATFSVFRPSALRWSVSFAAIILTVGLGVMFLSQDALPGDVLYSVKRASEKAQLVVTRDFPERTALKAVFSERRLSEAQRLVDREGSIAVQDEVRRALNESHEQLADAQEAIDILSEDSSVASREAVALIEDLVAQQGENLERLADTTDASLRSDVTEVVLDLLEVEKRIVLADIAQMEAAKSVVVINEGEEIPADEVMAVVETEASEGDAVAELRQKARLKVRVAGEKVDEVRVVIFDLHDVERDEDRDAVEDIGDRFSMAGSLIDLASREIGDKEYGSSFAAAVDALKILTSLKSDVLDLIDVIIGLEELVEEGEVIEE